MRRTYDVNRSRKYRLFVRTLEEFVRTLDFCPGPQRLSVDFSQDFSGKTFMFVDKTQVEAHLQTQAAEVGYSHGDFAIPCCRL